MGLVFVCIGSGSSFYCTVLLDKLKLTILALTGMGEIGF